MAAIDHHYYDNIAALDMEDKRLAAENKRADIDRDVRKKKQRQSRMQLRMSWPPNSPLMQSNAIMI